MSDEAAKKGITIAIVLGIVLGAGWSTFRLRYSLLEVRAWNAIGLTVIATLSIFAVIAAVRGFRARSRAPAADVPARSGDAV